MSTITIIKLYSLSPAGHYRAGKYISPQGTELDITGATPATLESIDADIRLVRPEAWADIIAAAREAKSEPKAKAKTEGKAA